MTAGGIVGNKRQRRLGAVIWDSATGRLLKEIEPHDGGADSFVSSAIFSPDGTRIVCGENDGVVRVCDARTGEELFQMKQRHGNDPGVFVWVVDVGRDPQTVKLGSEFEHVALLPDGGLVAFGKTGETTVIDTAAGQLRYFSDEHADDIKTMAVSTDGQWIVTGGQDTTIRIWDADTGRVLDKLEGDTAGITAIAVSRDKQFIVTGSRDGSLRIWDVPKREAIGVSIGDKVKSIAISPNGRWFVVAVGGKVTSVRDMKTGEHLRSFDWPGHSPQTVAISAAGDRVAVGSWAGLASVWDAASGQQLVELHGHSGRISSISFSPSGERVLTGSEDTTIRLWNTSTGHELLALKVPPGPPERPRIAGMSSDGRRITTVWDGRTVRVWHAASPEQIADWDREENATTRP